MNILPKKSWHVRNKDNIARVRRDEAKAAEEDRKRGRRVELAEQEARTDFLRKKASLLSDTSVEDELAVAGVSKASEHINFFQDVKECKGTSHGNREYEEEKRKEKEQREKALGILTYLGQSASEAQTIRPWYQDAPNHYKMDVEASSKDEKLKKNLDPLYEMDKYLHRTTREKNKCSEKKKQKTIRERKTKLSIEQLRHERLKREAAERTRTEDFLFSRNNSSNLEQEMDERKRQYNSQFNPQIARKP